VFKIKGLPNEALKSSIEHYRIRKYAVANLNYPNKSRNRFQFQIGMNDFGLRRKTGAGWFVKILENESKSAKSGES